MFPTRIALVGDYSEAVPAHRAIPLALTRVRDELAVDLAWEWLLTRALAPAAADLARQLAGFSGLWLVPASPYENTAGALAAVRFARETRIPFLGTCGGFQHALIEIARDVLGLTAADHAETFPTGVNLVVTRLACSLVEQTAPLRLAPGSRLREIYGTDRIVEGYRCNYGPSPTYRAAFERAGLRFTAFDLPARQPAVDSAEAGEIRAAELPPSLHPFFIGTLFQPERAALRGETPPLVRAFVRAALAVASLPPKLPLS